MKIIVIFLIFLSSLLGENMQSIYDIEVKTIEGKTIKMSEYKNKVLLIVNVASFCGFTSQYEGLEKLYKKYKTKDFVVLGFPCNQFMNQEPEDEQKIKEFCSLTYDVTFPMFSKVEVNGENTHDLYKLLKQEASGVLGTEAIKWNFTKFLVNKQGKIVERFAPSTTPESLEKQIENLL
ncbi:glutathione peroxidase [Malaciobacter mytili LMG 24559]|nr:glutathione peroxidase [Malaciobacter mytili LMG 24559]